ncbi:MAG TPA: hypothetical protein VFN74_13165 [Chloroflexota bacterium]|nr:hypothetical protein [Chloroflexota bacterium]
MAILAPAMVACAAPLRQGGIAQQVAAVSPPVPAPAPLTVARLRQLIPEAHLPAGLTLTEELVPRLDWRTAQEDPWGRVASYSATFASVHGMLDRPSEVTISLNSYLDAARAGSAFGDWRSLVPRQYVQVAHGAWRDVAWAPGASVAVYASERPRATLVGFTAGPLLGSVRVAGASTELTGGSDGREVYETPGPTTVALDLAAHVATALRGDAELVTSRRS